MAAYIFTKFYADRKKVVWNSVCRLIGVLLPEEFTEVIGSPGAGWEVKTCPRGPGQARAEEVDEHAAAAAVVPR